MRYIDSLNLEKNYECFILIEPGLGYIIPVLKEKFINSKIITLHVNESFQEKEIPAFYSTEPEKVRQFLEKELKEINTSLVKIIEWRPSMNIYRDEYVKLLSITVEFLKQDNAEKRTVSAFGKRWFRNFFKNLKIIEKGILYKTTDIPVIITGSGPSLEAAIPLIKENQNNCLIIAASSSIMALAENGISADIIAAADGGNWAKPHIYPLFRNKNCFEKSHLAINLCAAVPSQCEEKPFLFLNDGSFWQNIILHDMKIPSVMIPQRGTVTASAIDLALTLSSGNIYLAGVDLCTKDIRTHVRPYSFDYLLSENSNRYSPVYSKSFIRSNMIKGGGSLEIYAAWFKNQMEIWPKKIFSIDNIDPQKAANKEEIFKIFQINENEHKLYEKGLKILLAALKNSEYSHNLFLELTPMLFPGEKNKTEYELENAISEAACV